MINDLTLEKIRKEYDKLTCPICGCKPTTPFGSESCGHPELESLMEKAENLALEELDSTTPKYTKLVFPKGKVTLKVTTPFSTDPKSSK